MSFRAAVLCSSLFHVGFMGLVPAASWLPSRHALNTLEVFYASVPAAARAEPIRPAAPVPVKPSAARQQLAGQPARSAPDPASPKPSSPRPVPPSSVPKPSPAAPVPRVVEPSPPANSSVGLPEEEFAGVEHKEWVRRHLKAHLNYPSFLADGTVRIRLRLDPAGALREARILSASDLRLAGAAARDAQKAAPYPRFPQPMRRPETSYEFLVRYRPEDRSVD